MKYLLGILIFFISCNSKLNTNFDYNKSANPWIHAFKDRVFIASLKEAYKTDKMIFQLIEKKDAMNTYDGLSIYEMQKADEIGIGIINNMPKPLMCEGCTDGMNYYISTSLHYYESKELNLIAMKLYKLHLLNDKKIK